MGRLRSSSFLMMQSAPVRWQAVQMEWFLGTTHRILRSRHEAQATEALWRTCCLLGFWPSWPFGETFSWLAISAEAVAETFLESTDGAMVGVCVGVGVGSEELGVGNQKLGSHALIKPRGIGHSRTLLTEASLRRRKWRTERRSKAGARRLPHGVTGRSTTTFRGRNQRRMDAGPNANGLCRGVQCNATASTPPPRTPGIGLGRETRQANANNR